MLTAGWCLRASAQSCEIDWFTVDGGGGTSSDGVFEVTGTLGQPDAGSINIPGYEIAGGFWNDSEVVLVPGVALLTITLAANTTVIIAWPASGSGWVLQESSTMGGGTWTPVTALPVQVGANLQVTMPAVAKKTFYRLAQGSG
jgi:hypothetical protein